MRLSQYGTARALITKCIGSDEIGKVFSVIAFMTATMPFVSSPIYRLLYDYTIYTFPGAFLLLGASV